MIYIAVKKQKRIKVDEQSNTSSISSRKMELILEQLKSIKNRDSTKQNYLSVWQKFNQFVIKLDIKPNRWEDCTSLFGASLVQAGLQSSTLRSYMSAIKRILIDDGYQWSDDRLLLSSLIKGCNVLNDCIRTRLPIRAGLVEMNLFEISRIFAKSPQIYLETMYQTIIILLYYGLFRIGELTYSDHVVKAKHVHVSDNKRKILFVPYSSKTHSKGMHPQEITITENEQKYGNVTLINRRHFCPFMITNQYMELRGDFYANDNEPLFIFKDLSPVHSSHVRKILRQALKNLGLNPQIYNTHSLRAGRTIDMFEKLNKTLSFVKSAEQVV